MNSDLLTKWTAIITNVAVVIGLVFVGLEFRNTTRAVEADRIDSFITGAAEVDALFIENNDLAELIFKAHKDPTLLRDTEMDRIQSWMLMHYGNFQRQLLAHQAGLLPDDIYEQQKSGIGFVFSSEVGLELIDMFRATAMDNQTWEVIGESAKEARKYCQNTANKCMARYKAARERAR
jgi:hypothetical protein